MHLRSICRLCLGSESCRHKTIRPRRSSRCPSIPPCDRARGGRAGGGHRRPTVAGRIVAPAVVQIAGVAAVSAPDDHLAARPHRRVIDARGGRAGGAHRRPTVGGRIVAPAGVQIAAVVSAPDDHLAAGPHRRVTRSARRARRWCSPPSNCWSPDCSARRVQIAGCRIVRPRRSSRCPSTPPCDQQRAAGAPAVLDGRPTVRRRDCSARRCSNSAAVVRSAPDDHLAARPHRRVSGARGGRAGGAHWRPTVRRRDCSARRCSNRAAVGSAPDDHLAARPHRRVTGARGGRAGGAHRRPTVRCRIVAPAGVQIALPLSLRPRRSSRCPSTPPCDRRAPAGAPVVLIAVQLFAAGIVAPAGVQIARRFMLRPRRSSRCPSTPPCDDRAQRARRWCSSPSNCRSPGL